MSRIWAVIKSTKVSASFCTSERKEQGYWKQSDEGGCRQEEEDTNSDLTLSPVTTL